MARHRQPAAADQQDHRPGNRRHQPGLPHRTAPLRGQAATLEQLRVDRRLQEALVHGPDPLHLAEVFGLDEKTAIRYANSARALLEQPAEQTCEN
ncbi:hypothetical protein ACWGDX_11765 [Streptomyces sp. NPDC055025]